MKKAFFLIVLAAAWASAWENMDAAVLGAGGAAVLSGQSALAVYNCKIPSQADAKIEFVITRSSSCRDALVVSYERFDFVEKKFVNASQICIVPPGSHCVANVPIKLGGTGNGTDEIKLIRLVGNCSGVQYLKEFEFNISHRTDPVEDSILEKLAESNRTANDADGVAALCGDCCRGMGMEQDVNESRKLQESALEKLSACLVSEAMNDASLSLDKSSNALLQAEERYAQCLGMGNVTNSNKTNDTVLGPCALPCPLGEEQLAFPDCSCVKKPVTDGIGGNITGNTTLLNNSNGTGTGQSSKACGFFMALACALLLAVGLQKNGDY